MGVVSEQCGLKVDATVGRDWVAFDEFYRDQFRVALTLAALLTQNSDRAAELVQEVFADAFLRWGTLASYDRPDLWLRRAVINRCLSWHRRARSERRALRRLRPDTTTSGFALGDEVGLWALVALLPRRQAQAIALVYGDDMAVSDAARVMRCSTGSVKTHLSRGRTALEAKLKERS